MTFAISCSKSDFDEEINSTSNTFKVSISKAGEIAVGHIEINHFMQRLPEELERRKPELVMTGAGTPIH